MNGAVARTKTAELLERLGVVNYRAPLDELELRRIESEAAGLKNSNAVEYIIVKGALASIRGDRSETDQLFLRALAMAGSDSQVDVNFAVSLLVLGDGGAARGVLDSALSRYPSDMSLREGAFHLFEELGYFKSANTLASEIREMETEWREHSGIALFDSAWFKAVGHSEEEIAASVAVARSGLADAGFRRPRYDVWPTFCLGGPIARIAYELQIDGPSADLSTIETMVFEKLATAELAVEADGWISFSVARAVSVDVDSPERAI